MATRYTFNITDLSYDSLISQARSLASIYFPTWEFDNENDLGRFALDLYLHGVDRALWLANAWAGEWNLLTARERKHVEARALALGYPLKPRLAARGTVDVTFAAMTGSRTVPKNAIRFSVVGDDGDYVYYENEVEFSIPSSISQMTFNLIEGKSLSQTSVGTGKPFQEIKIAEQNVISGSVTVTIDGEVWSEVSSFGSSGPTSKHFVVEYLGDNDSRVVFGDGEYGATPVLNGATVLTSRIGGGVRGNIPSAGKITSIDATPYPFEVRGSSELSGGQDVESIDKIRLLAPRHRRAYDRMISVKDIETAVDLLEGVERCLVTLETRNIVVYVVPSDGGVPSSDVINAVFARLIDGILIGYTLTVLPPTYKSIDITITGTKKVGLLDAEVRASLQTNLLARLSSVGRDSNGDYQNDFGGSLLVSDIVDVVTTNGSLQPGFVVNVPSGPVTTLDTEIVSSVESTVTITLV